MTSRLGMLATAAVVLGVTGAALQVPSEAAVRAPAAPRAVAKAGLNDPFFHYAGTKPLKKYPLGAVLKTRQVNYSIQGLTLPLKTQQILFRTKNQIGRPTVGVTTVIRPLIPLSRVPKVISYQSFYDSLNPADQPSVAIAGGQGLGPAIANIETAIFAPALLAGYTINIPDTEGQTADFAAGPEYGKVTLDSLRAIVRAKGNGVTSKAPVGLIGYSGGAIASEWAAELAPTYSPGVAKRIVGTAIGGVLVHPGHNLHYVEGSTVWAGVMPMALVGIARSFHVDLSVYANAYGKKVMKGMEKASIAQVLGAYRGLTWKQIAKKRYDVPEKVGVYVKFANRLIMGRRGTPSAPMFIGQGTGGPLEGTRPHAKYGKGDGVMIAGDVRSLAREYCKRGVTVKYQEYKLSHFTSVVQWLPAAYQWLLARFGTGEAPSNCGSIKPGNSLAPIKRIR